VQAYALLGQFLILKKNTADFECWLKNAVNANSNALDTALSV